MNTVPPAQDRRIRQLREALADLVDSPWSRCLPAQLVALGWRGAPRQLLNGLPPVGDVLALADLRRLLRSLGYANHWVADQAGLTPGGLACWEGGCAVYLGEVDGASQWHDGQSVRTDLRIPDLSRWLHVRSDLAFQPLDAPQAQWLNRLLGRVERPLAGLALVSLVANLLALSVSLFTMVIYNRVIPSGATGSLLGLGAGVALAVFGGWWLRVNRLGLMAQLSAWVGVAVGRAAFRKTLGLPIEQLERLGLQNHLNRLRSMENLRQYIGGAGGTVLIDAPFVFIFLIVIALLGGWIVLVPVCGLLLFGLAAWLLEGPIQRRVADTSRLSSKVSDSLAVTLQRLRGLQGHAGMRTWLDRQHDWGAQLAVAQVRQARMQSIATVTSQALGNLTVLGTMVIGVVLVIDSHMSTGGLIAAMMLIWRVTTPAQQVFGMRLQLKQMSEARRQLDRLMLSRGEQAQVQQQLPVSLRHGGLQIERLYLRPAADRDAALNGLSFNVERGERVAVVGPNGAGKSLLLQCLGGLRAPQAGRIVVGGRDLRQIDIVDYRAWVGVLPQSPKLLPLSVREHLRMAHHAADDAQLIAALRLAGGLSWPALVGAQDEVGALDVILDPWRHDVEGVRIRHLMGLAEALVGGPALLLLDDPLRDGDGVLDPALTTLLDGLRGRCTVLMTTHRPDLIQSADKVLVLDQGNLIHFGPVVRPAANAEGTTQGVQP